MGTVLSRPGGLRGGHCQHATPSAQNIAFNEIARQAITADRTFGRAATWAGVVPTARLRLARMLGHVTYQSDDGWGKVRSSRAHRNLDILQDVQFQVESYLSTRKIFLPSLRRNTYLLMTRALDYFDPARAYGDDLVATFAAMKAKLLFISSLRTGAFRRPDPGKGPWRPSARAGR